MTWIIKNILCESST